MIVYHKELKLPENSLELKASHVAAQTGILKMVAEGEIEPSSWSSVTDMGIKFTKASKAKVGKEEIEFHTGTAKMVYRGRKWSVTATVLAVLFEINGEKGSRWVLKKLNYRPLTNEKGRTVLEIPPSKLSVNVRESLQGRFSRELAEAVASSLEMDGHLN